VPGEYLLVLDIVTPDQGSVAASGAEPTLIRVHVTAKSAEAPAATPEATSAPATAPAATSAASSGDE
jgi:hypothetical protein